MSDDHGTVCWTELMTNDPAAAVAFYTKVCGWEVQEVPMPGGLPGVYRLGMKGGVPVAGIMDMSLVEGAPPQPPHWFTYFGVDDVDAACAAAEAAGGTVTQPPFDLLTVGRIALVTDASGAALGLMKPEPME